MRHNLPNQTLRLLFGLLLLAAPLPAVLQPCCAAPVQQPDTDKSRKPVSVNFQSAPVITVLNAIQKQSGLSFVYSSDLAATWHDITIRAANEPAEEVVSQVSGMIGCTYEIRGTVVTLTPLPQSDVKGRERKVSGQVADESGETLPGVTITVRDGRVAAITDVDGNYTLTIPAERTLLRFTYVGMETKEVTIARGSADVTQNVTMNSGNQLGEVVVTGIFQKNREAYTGAVTVIKSEDLKLFGNKNLISSISNIDPSFNMLTNNTYGSNPNHLPEVQIRGNANLPALTDVQDNTNTDLNTPLIVLDGFEISLERMMDLNEEDVESITLLKDGSATAIYGSRGANGVIVITRKAPKAGRLKLTYNGSLNIEAPDLSDYHLLNAADKLELERRAGYYDMVEPQRDYYLKRKYAALLQDVERGVDTDWMAQPLRSGVGHKHNLRLEGGDESFRYAASLQYNGVAGVMKGSDRNSFNGGINLSYRTQHLIFNNDLTIGYTKSTESPYGEFSDYTRLNPYWRPYDDDGNLIKLFDTDTYFWGTFSNLPTNPLYNATLNQRNSQDYTDITENFSIEWRPVEGLIARGRAGITWKSTESDDYKPANHTMFEADQYQTAEGALRKGLYRYATGKTMNYELALTVSYSKLLAEKHLIYAGFNANVISNNARTYSFAAEGFADDDLDFLPTALQYQQGGKPGGSEAKTRSVGLVASLNYSYDNRYFADLAYRLDGSSQFGSDKRFAPFYSVGIGWNLHHEPFMQRVKFVNLLKIRGSFGQTGSQRFNAYQAIATYNYYLSNRYNQWIGAYQQALENPGLEWQKTNKWNAGVEVNTWDNRINLVADVYLEKTSNLLSSLDLPLSSGFTSYVENVGRVENRGFELKATLFLVRNVKQRLAWSLTGSVVHNRDRVVELSQAMKSEYAKLLLERGTTPNKVIREGESQYTIYAVPSLGIDPSNGMELYVKRNGEVTYTWDAADRVACGVSEPKFRGNLSSMVRWRNFTANVTFGYRFGGQLYNQTLATRIENADKQYNVDRRVFDDRWQQVGDHSLFKGLTNESATYATTRFVQDERTLTCQNLHLSYELHGLPWLVSHLAMQSLTLGADLSDLFYVSTVKQERGLSYPYSRRFSFTLSASF